MIQVPLNIFQKVSGVYIWRRGEEYLYVGQSEHVYKRLTNHSIIGIFDEVQEGDTIEIEECSIDNLVYREAELIAAHKPLYNSRGSANKVISRFRRAFPDITDAEILDLIKAARKTK